jgi:DNA primase
MDYQRKLSAGKVKTKEEEAIKEFFKDMQSILRPIAVRNPYAEQLKLPEYIFKPLRTNAHYLAVIETITFYHQYQREVKTDKETNEKYIETTLEDIEWANKLLKDVLLAKADELSGGIRRFFEKLKDWMKTNKKESFYKNEIRDAFRMNPNNLKYYLLQLQKYNRIKVVGGNRYKTGLEYEITNTEDYQKLNQVFDNELDKVLEKIRKMR